MKWSQSMTGLSVILWSSLLSLVLTMLPRIMVHFSPVNEDKNVFLDICP